MLSIITIEVGVSLLLAAFLMPLAYRMGPNALVGVRNKYTLNDPKLWKNIHIQAFHTSFRYGIVTMGIGYILFVFNIRTYPIISLLLPLTVIVIWAFHQYVDSQKLYKTNLLSFDISGRREACAKACNLKDLEKYIEGYYLLTITLIFALLVASVISLVVGPNKVIGIQTIQTLNNVTSWNNSNLLASYIYLGSLLLTLTGFITHKKGKSTKLYHSVYLHVVNSLTVIIATIMGII